MPFHTDEAREKTAQWIARNRPFIEIVGLAASLATLTILGLRFLKK